MAKVRVVPFERSLPLAPPTDAKGTIESHAYIAGAGDPLHLARHRLAPGASLRLRGDPADRLAYVFAGTVEVRGTRLAEGASMIAEFGTEADLVAGCEGAIVLVFAEAARGSAARAGGHLHLLPRESVPCVQDLGTQNEMGGGIHADAACPTCSIWLHENDFHGKHGTVVPLHSHSEDEIIFVTAGEIRLGAGSYGAGTALAIAADTTYGFEAAPGLSFINFRAASPTVTTPRGKHDEAQMWAAQLGKPRYVELAST